MESSFNNLKEYLDQKVKFYNVPGFIENDPISIPHLFSAKQDIEIAGILAATIAWGNRKSIISNAKKIMQFMEMAPFDFVMHFKDTDLKPFETFVHRTFNGTDCKAFLWSLKHIYQNHNGLEAVFKGKDIKEKIINFRKVFFEMPHPYRTEKHVADPGRNSSAKRINMFLRWMARNDNKGVDFGIWESIRPSMLMCPLDVHSGRTARNLGLLHRKQNDWKAVEVLTKNLRDFDSSDPVKYDFALFGIGVQEKLLQTS